MVCHAVNETDKSVRSGPNLYSLFQKTPRDREVLSSVSGIKVSVKADKITILIRSESHGMYLPSMKLDLIEGRLFLK